MAKCTFLGLGVMGFPMAAHLVKAGHEVTVYNRTLGKAQAWAEENGGQSANTPRDAAQAGQAHPASTQSSISIASASSIPDTIHEQTGKMGLTSHFTYYGI